MVLLVLLVLLEVLVLLEALVELDSIKPRGQTDQTEVLHLVVPTIIMWHQDTPILPELIIITTIRHDTLTVTGIL